MYYIHCTLLNFPNLSRMKTRVDLLPLSRSALVLSAESFFAEFVRISINSIHGTPTKQSVTLDSLHYVQRVDGDRDSRGSETSSSL